MAPAIQTFTTWKPLIAFAVAIMSTGLSATWYLSAKMSKYESRMQSVENDRYTLTMASEKALREAIENPGFRVPDPRDPTNIIVVEVPESTP